MPEEIKVYCDACQGGKYKTCSKCGGDGYIFQTFYDGIEIQEMNKAENAAIMEAIENIRAALDVFKGD